MAKGPNVNTTSQRIREIRAATSWHFGGKNVCNLLLHYFRGVRKWLQFVVVPNNWTWFWKFPGVQLPGCPPLVTGLREIPWWFSNHPAPFDSLTSARKTVENEMSAVKQKTNTPTNSVRNSVDGMSMPMNTREWI